VKSLKELRFSGISLINWHRNDEKSNLRFLRFIEIFQIVLVGFR
jgi:hypothetical protein